MIIETRFPCIPWHGQICGSGNETSIQLITTHSQLLPVVYIIQKDKNDYSHKICESDRLPGENRLIFPWSDAYGQRY